MLHKQCSSVLINSNVLMQLVLSSHKLLFFFIVMPVNRYAFRVRHKEQMTNK